MKINALILILVIALAGLGTFWFDFSNPGIRGQKEKTENNTLAYAKQLVPDVSLPLIDGQKIDLHDFKGRVVVLNFWASWCVPCIVEFPQLLDLAADYPDDLILIALSSDHNVEDVQAFLKKQRKTHAQELKQENVYIALDLDRKVTRDVFQTVRYPETIIIGPDLIMRDKIAGVIEWNDPLVREKIEALF